MINIFSDVNFRIAALGVIALLGVGLLTGKLFVEQIHHEKQHRNRIVSQSVRRIRIPAKRGKIFTSDLKILASNSAGCMIVFYPAEMLRPGRRSKTIDYIAQAAAAVSSALNLPNPLTREKINRHLYTKPGLPLVLFRSLSVTEAAPALTMSRYFDGIGLEEDNSRDYPLRQAAAHLIGYTRRENPNAANDRKSFFYYIPDESGRTGLEKLFDNFPSPADGNQSKNMFPPGEFPGASTLGLRGIPGYTLAMVDIRGFIRDANLDKRPPIDGNNLILTIDSRAQKLAEKHLAGKRGAFILLNAETGAVLAMASAPAHDLSRFVPFLSHTYYNELLADPRRPLLNRAIHGIYTPGSIIKVLVAMALLENGFDPETKIECTGKAAVGTTVIRCAARNGHGQLNLVEALEHSCNVYFIEAGLKTGMETISEMFRRAGVGQKTGFELPERSGLCPSAAYKQQVYKTSWNNFDTAQISIGQGLLLLTPLQAATYTAAIANGGVMLRPYVVDRLVDGRGGTLWQQKRKITGKLRVSDRTLDVVRQGMFRVVNSPVGSGRQAANEIIKLYGKTGSAEVGPRDNRIKNTWFIAFGTHKDVTYAAAMLVEEGASGGSSCAPHVSEFFREYLDVPDIAL